MFLKLLLTLAISSCAAVIPDGKKTVVMLRELDAGIFLHYNSSDQTLEHRNVNYRVLKGSTRDISQYPVVSIGSNPAGREIISLDPAGSPVLQKKYEELVTFLGEGDPFWRVIEFVRESVFDEDQCHERDLNRFVYEWKDAPGRVLEDFTETRKGQFIPVIPLDDFIRARVGCCGQHALVTAYFLDRLSKESKIPAGSCYFVRDMVRRGTLYGGHAWNLYVLEDKSVALHLDAAWNISKNLNDLSDLNFLYRAYGVSAIRNERTRFIGLVSIE